MGLHFIDGEKGGVGKSFFTEILIDYCQKFDIAFYLIDADYSNPDIYNRYPSLAKSLNLNQDQNHLIQVADEIFQLGLEKNKETIINLPSNIASAIDLWVDKSNILELAREEEIQLYKWFVSTGQEQSINALKNSLKLYGNQWPHILIRNLMILSEEEWDSFLKDDKEYQELIDNYVRHYIDLGYFLTNDFNDLNRRKLNLQAAQTEENQKVVMKNRIQKYLSGIYSQISDLEILS